MMIGFQNYDDIFPYFVVMSLYGYAITAFVIRYIVDIPWELSAFLAICLMAINEFGYDVLEKSIG
ncbi:MAG: hypothetical protein AAGB32_00610 [Pseudomonadota bacterium]